MDEDESFEPYLVEYTDEVARFISKHVRSSRVLDRIENYCQLLANFPDLGTPYDPDYPAARLPFPCRFVAVPDTPFTFYYLKVEEARKIVILYVEHQGIDPNVRFDWECLSF